MSGLDRQSKPNGVSSIRVRGASAVPSAASRSYSTPQSAANVTGSESTLRWTIA
jgi:hypothetical protein